MHKIVKSQWVNYNFEGSHPSYFVYKKLNAQPFLKKSSEWGLKVPWVTANDQLKISWKLCTNNVFLSQLYTHIFNLKSYIVKEAVTYN